MVESVDIQAASQQDNQTRSVEMQLKIQAGSLDVQWSSFENNS